MVNMKNTSFEKHGNSRYNGVSLYVHGDGWMSHSLSAEYFYANPIVCVIPKIRSDFCLFEEILHFAKPSVQKLFLLLWENSLTFQKALCVPVMQRMERNKTQCQLCKRLAGPFIPFSWSCLLWKRVSLWSWSLGGSQQLFSFVLGHLTSNKKTTKQPGDPSVSLLLISLLQYIKYNTSRYTIYNISYNVQFLLCLVHRRSLSVRTKQPSWQYLLCRSR